MRTTVTIDDGLVAQALEMADRGVVDLSLLASACTTPLARLWTRDSRLATLARRYGVDFQPRPH